MHEAYWVARYRDRDDVREGQVDWANVPRAGMVEVRLHCPDGQVAVLGHPHGIDDRAIQYKEAIASPDGRKLLRQVIGILTDTHGGALCYWWDYPERRLMGPVATTVEPGVVGILGPAAAHLAFEHLGVKAD